jgi:hypothetical protein
MSLEKVYQDIKNSFSNLWQTKQRGNSLEIITPYATTSNRFVSVFITKQGSEYVITDGGWINGGVYDNISLNEEASFLKILYHFQSSLGIQEVASNDGITYYYLKATNPIDIPSRVFDLSSFIQSIVSVAEISFESVAEKETKARFFSKANEFLRSFIQSDKIKFSQYLNAERKELRFNAIYYNKTNQLTLINYITGSTQQYFENSIFKTNTLFEMADLSVYKDFVTNKVSLIDTNASGFLPEKVGHYLSHLQNRTGSKMVNWHEKQKLQSILNQ